MICAENDFDLRVSKSNELSAIAFCFARASSSHQSWGVEDNTVDNATFPMIKKKKELNNKTQ